MCWNYRNYGNSTGSLCGSLSPYYCKLDAEKVLDFVVNKLQISGKIGVYGRSLGGIACCHLASKYSDIVKALLVDRTFCDMS